MRHGTAVRRLRTIAERCQQLTNAWRGEPVLLAAYAYGDVLELSSYTRTVEVAFVLNLPSDELPWCAQPLSCPGLPRMLDIEQAPVDWSWRPAAWPVSNHRIRRPLRIWSIAGPDKVAIDALARKEADPLRLPAPPPEQEDQQLITELNASLRHLRRVKESFWERDWRAEHRGPDGYPDNYLWDAVHGYLDLLDAVENRRRERLRG